MDDSIPPTSGIYKITCLVTTKIYIGSAINLRQRQKKHFYKLRINKHENAKLQNAWNKYGEQSFTFEVLELVLTVSLTAREQYWFHKLKPFGNKGFNIARQAGSTLGILSTPEQREKQRQAHLGKKQSPEACEKKRQAGLRRKHTPEELEKMRNSHLGKKRPPEVCEKVRQAHLGMKRTPESIEKQRQALLGRKQTPEHKENLRLSRLRKKNNLTDNLY